MNGVGSMSNPMRFGGQDLSDGTGFDRMRFESSGGDPGISGEKLALA